MKTSLAGLEYEKWSQKAAVLLEIEWKIQVSSKSIMIILRIVIIKTCVDLKSSEPEAD